ncbi:bifunctional ADP-dependent (S)-NAD(P)H-hydrate dehydratase/NAD(P)H-hydrate epimerase [Poseidonibacter parvus]|uniref:Bifunctional NAD(P)H-hydrate repair enzyme n=1 Tax=Poseidonibacter parvus TaxID=1850254 RepID=A0A1P8KJ28_9BACT|nr:bifunctional ADP-dependent NAD(P)H-hydrate dehydratase/NAD(P)H-hydrate epimerase [Poseidonibacter parvus]APW64558.1 bifunctional ADP-dependent (S)-NAD(P)H-hydrate dehydratase/NAD(P)H-hydrate epimerase [Poseidonibacter parvus]
MQKIFDEVNSLDKRCYEEFGLSEDILMEHAALSMQLYIQENHSDKKTILIACGCGNNGADGIALARLLHKKFDVSLYFYSKAKSQMAILQEKRAKALDIPIIEEVIDSDIIVDCIFGTGLNKALDDDAVLLINELNSLDAIKIACDIPSGISFDGQVKSVAFDADVTITMGALKTSLFSDIAKDFVGEIKVANLGVQREIYETSTNKYLLEKKDLKLPNRKKHNSHKGSYGHLNVVAGCKKGAGIIAAKAAFGFGTGIVSVVCHENLDLPYHIMQTHFISKNCTAIAIGMGLGNYEIAEVQKILANDVKKIVDADLFYDELLLDVLDEDIVLTPHPKEFCSLLKLSNIADISVEQLQNNRIKYVEEFTSKYPKVVLLLKGTNVIISQGKNLYINTFGSAVLSKGGSGDVLSGLVGSLLAQGYEPLDAAISASLAHALAGANYKKNDFSLIPSDLIEEVRRL